MKRKIYLELAITLIVGFLIGFFVNSIVTDKRIKEFSLHKGEAAFWRRALTEIEASDEQVKEIMPIIKAYAEETREILHQSWAQIPPIWEQMESEIMPLLSQEQQLKIKEIQENRKRHVKDNINKRPRRDQDKQGEYNGKRPDRSQEGKRQRDREHQAPRNAPPQTE